MNYNLVIKKIPGRLATDSWLLESQLYDLG